jgi:pimeloyl-ACP methyl ester carboxylesterase
METVRSKDGTTIAFDRQGSGPPLVLVGGALSNRGAAADLAALLAPHLMVLAYDRRGRGASTDTVPYAVDREIEDLEALIGAAGGSASLYGHSSGGVLALRAAGAGQAITRLAVYEPPFIVDHSRDVLPRDFVDHVDHLLAAGRRGDAVAYFMTVAVQVPEEIVSRMRGSPMWAAMEEAAPTLAYDNRIMDGLMTGDRSPLERWATLPMPILALDGGASPAWARNAVGALAEAVPQAGYRTIEGQDHGVQPAVLAPVLEAFFVRE